MPIRCSIAITLFACVPSSAVQGQPDALPALETTAFVNVNVVPMDRETVLPNQTIIVRGGRIHEIGPASKVTVPEGAVAIDGRGKYLMPGLTDMHVHLEPEDADGLIVFLANGVTAVRNMWGGPEHLEWRKRINSGNLLGPTICTTGPITDGNPPWWPGSTVIETPEEAEQEVLRQKQAGYDGIKVFSNLQPRVYEAVLAAAKRHDFRVYGHVPTCVGLEKALDGGQRSVEHMTDFVYALLPDDSPVRNGVVDAFSDMTKRNLQSVLLDPFAQADRGKIHGLAAKAKSAGVWFCPTLGVNRKWAANAAEFEAFRKHPSMQHLAPGHWASWNKYASGFSSEQGDPAVMKHGFDTMLLAVRALHDVGARLVVGTDTPNPFVVPGFSIHEELKHFVDAGMTPYEVIKAGTHDAAEFLDALDEWGTVAEGRRADLILVEANPLDDVSNAARGVGVMVRGRWYPQAELQAKLDALAEKYAKEKAKPGAKSPDPGGE